MENNKIFKYSEFIKENLHETPEQYVFVALSKIKNTIEKMFSGGSQDEVSKMKDLESKEKKQKGSMSLVDMGVELQSCELSKYSKTQDNVKVKFSDDKALYDLTIAINLKDAVPEDEEKDFSDEDIKQCFIKFKMYEVDNFELLGELSKNIDIKDINEDLLIKLKIELDEKFGGGSKEEFEIET